MTFIQEFSIHGTEVVLVVLTVSILLVNKRSSFGMESRRVRARSCPALTELEAVTRSLPLDNKGSRFNWEHSLLSFQEMENKYHLLKFNSWPIK